MTLAHQEPDRPPIDVGGTACSTMILPAYLRLCEELGVEVDGPELISFTAQSVQMDERVLERLGVDFRSIRPNPPRGGSYSIHPDGSVSKEWGVTWMKGVSSYHPVGHPLERATLRDLDSYPWMDPYDPARFEGVRERARCLYENTRYALVADLFVDPMEVAQWLRGFDTLMMDLVLDPDFAGALLDKILEVWLPLVERFLQEVGEYVQVVTLGDDLGGQHGCLISPRTYRQIVKPRHARLIAAVKAHTTAKIFYHSCGSCYDLLEDLIEIGVDILHPVQVTAAHMDPVRLKREFGDRLTFWGAIDTQHVLPWGTPQEVEAEVRRRIDELGWGGGYMVAAVHNIQAEVPPANVIAMCRAAREWHRA